MNYIQLLQARKLASMILNQIFKHQYCTLYTVISSVAVTITLTRPICHSKFKQRGKKRKDWTVTQISGIQYFHICVSLQPTHPYTLIWYISLCTHDMSGHFKLVIQSASRRSTWLFTLKSCYSGQLPESEREYVLAFITGNLPLIPWHLQSRG